MPPKREEEEPEDPLEAEAAWAPEEAEEEEEAEAAAVEEEEPDEVPAFWYSLEFFDRVFRVGAKDAVGGPSQVAQGDQGLLHLPDRVSPHPGPKGIRFIGRGGHPGMKRQKRRQGQRAAATGFFHGFAHLLQSIIPPKYNTNISFCKETVTEA